VRPKLLAIEVSGRHRVPVIARASSRGRQARAGGHGPRDVTQAQDLGQGRYWKVIPGHRPDGHRRGRTLLMAVPPDTVTGPGSGGQAGESPGSGDDCSPCLVISLQKAIWASSTGAESK